MKFYFWIFFILLLVACSQTDIHKSIDKEQLPKVVAVYPTTDSLPENLLRIYVQFSQSMKAVNNLENIKLVNDKGEEIKGAIFNNVYELWDSEQKQLTLILDPARVKTGLVVNETLGRALVPGRHFQLIIKEAEDIYGQSLKEPFIKNIFVQQEDKKIPDVNKWGIITPNLGSNSALHIQFQQILDRLSLFHQIRLLNADKEIVQGKIELANQETEWRFIPKDKWKKGNYILQINSRLEDPAGNNLNGLFDHKIGDLKNELEGEIIEIPIKIE